MGGRQGWQGGVGGPPCSGERTSPVSSQGEWGSSGSYSLSGPRLALPWARIFIRGFGPTLAPTPSPAPGQISRESDSHPELNVSTAEEAERHPVWEMVPPQSPSMGPSAAKPVPIPVCTPQSLQAPPGPGLAQAVEQSWRGIAHSTDEKTEHLPRARPCAALHRIAALKGSLI